jgi:hypothetical protein
MLPAILNIHPPTVTADNTPDAVNWGNIAWYIGDSFGTITSKQITGISNSINLNVSDFITSPDAVLYYQVSNSEITGNITSAPTSPWQQVSEFGTTFSVNNNQWVSFCCYGTGNTKNAETISVYNQSNSNVLLDTFTIDVEP